MCIYQSYYRPHVQYRIAQFSNKPQVGDCLYKCTPVLDLINLIISIQLIEQRQYEKGSCNKMPTINPPNRLNQQIMPLFILLIRLQSCAHTLEMHNSFKMHLHSLLKNDKLLILINFMHSAFQSPTWQITKKTGTSSTYSQQVPLIS